MAFRLQAYLAKVRARLICPDKRPGVARALALILLPIRRPFLFLANVCAELGVLFQRLSLLLVKAEGHLLKLEKARLKFPDKP